MNYKFIFLFYILLISFKKIICEDKKNLLREEKEERKTIQYKKFNFKPDSNNVKNIGRFFFRDEIIYLAQSGSAIEFYIIGKTAEIIIAGDGPTILHEEYEKPRYSIYVNEILLLDTTIKEKEKTILLFNNDLEQKNKIKIILLSEAILGCIGIKNIIVLSSYSENEIIKPTEKKKYSIEFIGDSITCAYGIEAQAPSQFFETKTQNFEKSYAYLSAKELDFDYSVVCYSGCGILTTGNIMSQRYTKINYLSNNTEWDFENYHNDIIVINLGTNDFGYVWGFRIDEYVEKYAEFLKLVREKNPNSLIICLLGMMGCEDLFPLIDQAINLTGDEKILGFLLPAQKIQDGIGAEFHPNCISHSKWGQLVAQIIKDVINIYNSN